MRVVLFFAASCLAAAAQSPQIQIDPAEPNAYTHLDVKNNPRDFQFAIISDRTGGERAGKFREGVHKLNLLKPEFVMSVGDGIEGYTEDPAEMDREWDELDGIMAESEAPFFYVPGNHDISNEYMLQAWKARYGSPYYSFVYQDVLFIILNSEDPPPKQLSDEQLAFVQETLDKHPDVRWTFFFMHVPLWQFDHPTNWENIEAIVADRNYTVFAGHTHDYLKTKRQGQKYIILATTGGGSQLMGPAQGEFDQVAWVTMTDDGPVVANLLLNGIWNENVRTPEVVDLVRPLEDGSAITSTPILVDGDTFKSGVSTVTLTNPADRPMDIEAWVHAQPNLTVSPSHIGQTVAPKSTATVSIAVATESPGPWLTFGGPVIDYRITYAVEDREPLEYTQRHTVMIDGPIACMPVKAVDGGMKLLPNACTNPAVIDQALQSWHGPADSSFRFGTGYDKDFVYVALDVTDDDMLFRDREEASRKDGVEIRLDARPADIRRTAPASAINDPEKSKDVLLLGLSLDESAEVTTVYKQGFLPKGTKAKATKVDGGYVVEAAVPVTYLNEMQGGAWKDFRLNITVHDYDEGYSYPRVALWWRPDWNSPQNYPESGTFVRK